MAALDMHSDAWSPEAELDGDVGGKGLGGMTDFLRQRRSVVQARLDRGVKPEEFERGKRLLDAFDAAIRGLDAAWSKRYPR